MKVDTYQDSQNVETVHRTDELGNIVYRETAGYINSQPDLNDVTESYDSYVNDYNFTSDSIGDQTIRQLDNRHEGSGDLNQSFDFNVTKENDFLKIDSFQTSIQSSDDTYDDMNTHMTAEELLLSEREREKKSKKELEEEEREKMQ